MDNVYNYTFEIQNLSEGTIGVPNKLKVEVIDDVSVDENCPEWVGQAMGCATVGSVDIPACEDGPFVISTNKGFEGEFDNIIPGYHWAYRQLCGDGTLSFQVSLDNFDMTAGVLLRDNLNTWDNALAFYKASLSTPTIALFAVTSNSEVSNVLSDYSSYQYMRISRNGSNFTVSASNDGVTWIEESIPLTLPNFGDCLYIGIFVASTYADCNPVSPVTATFQDVSIIGNTGAGITNSTLELTEASIEMEEGTTANVCINLTDPCNCSSPTSVDLVLVSDPSPYFDNFTTQAVNFENGETQVCIPVSVPNIPTSGANTTFTFELQNVFGGNNAQIGTANQVEITVLEDSNNPPTPPGSCTNLYPGDLMIIGYDNDIGGNEDYLVITNLVPLHPQTSFSIANAVYEAGAPPGVRTNTWHAPNNNANANIHSQLITYMGTEIINAGTTICFSLPNQGSGDELLAQRLRGEW